MEYYAHSMEINPKDGKMMPNVSQVLRAIPQKIVDVPFGSFTASATYNGRFNAVLNRAARGRTILVVNKLNQPASGNVYIVGYDSMFPKPTYSYTGSQGLGTILANGVGVLYGSGQGAASTAPIPVCGMDSIEIQFPMGATAPTSGNVEIWAVEFL